MSLTWKLILGFLFALVLQVAQMVISGYFTANMQRAAEVVSDALQSNIAVHRSIDVSRTLRNRIADDLERGTEPNLALYGVYLDELRETMNGLAAELAAEAPEISAQLIDRRTAMAAQLRELQTCQGGDPETIRDALWFLDDGLTDTEQALQHAQTTLGKLGEQGVAVERSVRNLPLQAGMAITAAGVLIMALFVAWFSRQLVIPIEKAWAQLETRVEERTAELAETVAALETEIVERQRAESQREELHRQLVDASRQAGMAELANGVLHNVGNVLNSVNVSANVLLERLRGSRADGLGRALGVLQDDVALGPMLRANEQGRKVLGYLDQLGRHLADDRTTLLAECTELAHYVDHMKDIVHRQQAYARVGGATSRVHLGELVDDVLRMHASSFARHHIEVVSRVDSDEVCMLDRSRAVQILMNLLKNAKQAVAASGRADGRITITLEPVDERTTRLVVEDNGIGIAPDLLTRVFAHGFTTKVDGHGFGLHHSANAATEMGGRLWAESAGPGHGARFVLELPLESPCEVTA